MDLAQLIRHPEQLNKDTVYDLRSILALHPYYQTARILLLQNLYLLHDPTFDEELRRAAVYITDRRVLFQLVEAMHYQPRRPDTVKHDKPATDTNDADQSRTTTLIDQFLGSIPNNESQEKAPKRRPTPADATIDYVAYLLDIEEEQPETTPPATVPATESSRMDTLINDFIEKDGGNFDLKDEPEYTPDLIGSDEDSEPNEGDEGYFTETLARIYIKQGRYSKALEIIKRLNLLYPKKNRYFADQIRFLEKLVINNNNKITEK